MYIASDASGHDRIPMKLPGKNAPPWYERFSVFPPPCLLRMCNHYMAFSQWECSDSTGVVARCTLHDAAVGETCRGWHISDVY